MSLTKSGNVQGYDFKCEPERNSYVVRNRAGVRKYGSGYEELAIQEAIDSLKNARTSKQKVLLRGDFPSVAGGCGHTNDCIQFPAYTIIEVQGALTLADAVNKNMFANENQASYDLEQVLCGHGRLLGNGDLNTTKGHGVYIRYASSITESLRYRFPTIKIKDLKIDDFRDNSIYANVQGCAQAYIEITNLETVESKDYGIELLYFYDGLITGGRIAGDMRSIRLERCNRIHITPKYLGSGSILKHCVNLDVTGLSTDMSTQHNITMEGVKKSVFSGVILNRIGDGVTDKDAINLASDGSYHCTDNIFNGIWCGRGLDAPDTSQDAYGIQEVDSNQNYNTYGVINGRDTVTGALRVLGANSKYDIAIVQGSVITE